MTGEKPGPRIHLTGASGSGTTTLGRALAARYGLTHFDVDDYYWEPTDPPFLRKRTYGERVRLLNADIDDRCGWVISGSMMHWGEAIADRAGLILFLTAPTHLRVERLRRRELAEIGPRILPGGDMHRPHENFIAWASGYDDADFRGRSRVQHEAWLTERRAPVLRLDGTAPLTALTRQVDAHFGR